MSCRRARPTHTPRQMGGTGMPRCFTAVPLLLLLLLETSLLSHGVAAAQRHGRPELSGTAVGVIP